MPVRAIKTTTISILIIGLLAGSAVGVAAHDEASPEATFVTGTVGASTVIGEPVVSVADGVEDVRGLVREGPIEMSDPRLTGSLVRVLNYSFHPVSSDGALVIQTDLWRIENDRGSWSGPTTAISGVDDIPIDFTTDLESVVLTGEGDYDGLSAYLIADWTPETGADIQGAIFAGEMPPTPEEYAPAE
jgi:hypothetical protein